ncbi:MAG: hybrid sensor histidine kinase/response regulator [Oligoflexia bacterium]|nr:hybrid sensor histidine kinase/response regulator [Oligoflexia bacterium]
MNYISSIQSSRLVINLFLTLLAIYPLIHCKLLKLENFILFERQISFLAVSVIATEIFIFINIFCRIKKTSGNNKYSKFLMLSFLFLFIAEIIYALNIFDVTFLKQSIAYLCFLCFTISSVLMLAFFVLSFTSDLKNNKIILSIIATSVLYLYINWNFILKQALMILPDNFYKINAMIYAVIAVSITTLAFHLILKENRILEFVFLLGIILQYISDFAIRFNEILPQYHVTGFEYGWQISVSIMALAIYNKKNLFENNFHSSWMSLRSVVSVLGVAGVTVIFVYLVAANVIRLDNAFSFTHFVLAILIAFIFSNILGMLVSLKAFNAVTFIRNSKRFETENTQSTLSEHIIPFVKENTKIFELDEFINEYNSLSEYAQNMLKRLVATSRQAAIATTTQMLAHDVRKPFASIKSVLNMLDVLKDNPSALLQAKKDIGKAIKNVEAMISDIMDFSREVVLETKAKSLVTLIDFSIRQTAQSYKGSSIDFNYDFSNKYCPLVDDERLARVLTNIVGNGIEAITIIGNKKHGNIWIKSKDNENHVELIIGNDGPHFKEEDIPKLFESFFTKGKKKGTGLGLASAQKIIHLHKGSINARNVIGSSGVEFIIKLPTSMEIETHTVEILPKNIQEITEGIKNHDESFIDETIRSIAVNGPFKVLLLEDEALYRASVRNTIKHNPDLHKILTLYEVHNVEDAIKVVAQEKIEWAIVDIDLGEIKNGFDFLGEAKVKFPQLKAIVHSNRCLKEDKEKAKHLGAIDFAPKPLELYHLVNLFSYAKDSFKNVIVDAKFFYNCVYIDDDHLLIKYWEFVAKKKNIKLLTLTTTCDFAKHEESISKDYTGIYLDQNYGGSEIKGDEFAKILHEKGYKNINLVTGEEPENFAHLKWLKVYGKNCPFDDC